MRHEFRKSGAAARAWRFGILWGVLAMALGAAGVPARAEPFAYVPNQFSNSGTVSVIDTAKNEVVKTITVGPFPYGVTVTPNGRYAYINVGTNVAVIDTAHNMVAAMIDVGAAPTQVGVTPDGRFAYVTKPLANNVSVIDTATNKVFTTIEDVASAAGIAVAPNGKFVYATNSVFNAISVIDTAKNEVVETITPVGDNPVFLALTPDGRFAYVTNAISNTVSVISTAKNKVVATIDVETFPAGVAISPHGTRAYVTNYGTFQAPGSSVSVIDTLRNKVIDTIKVGTNPTDVAFTPDGRFAYVANQGTNTVSVIDTAKKSVVKTVNVGEGPTGIGIVPPSALQVTPTSDIVIVAKGRGKFAPSSFKYELQATTGSVKVAIAGIPSWLNASFTSASVTTSPLVVTFSLKKHGALFHHPDRAKIAFINKTNGHGNTTRTVTLKFVDEQDCKDGKWRHFPFPPGPFRNQDHCINHLARHVASP
jgi:YVTN family beta-propeller protein